MLFFLSRYSLEDEPSNLDEMPLMMSEEGFENDESDYHTLPRARANQRQRGLGWLLMGGWKILCGRYVGSGTTNCWAATRFSTLLLTCTLPVKDLTMLETSSS